MDNTRILFVGLGGLGAQVFDLFVRVPGGHRFLVGGRDLNYLHQRTNLSVLAAVQLGYDPEVAYTHMDLWNVEQTAHTIARFQPDIIFCAATLQQWGDTKHLPQPLTERLTAVQMGPRLPLHLTLIYKLMQAVHATRLPIKVINAIYPDVVNPVLAKIGLAPTTGVGDLANNVPALRMSIAQELSTPLEQVEVCLVMAHYISYWMSRTSVRNTPFHFTALVNGEDITSLLNVEAIFSTLSTRLKRQGGSTGLLMTAASAAVVFEGLVKNTGVITHAPGPCGLPGGYPIRVDAQGVEVALPSGLTLARAVQLNEAGFHLDGIEKIDDSGTVYFRDKEMAVMKEVLGYSCQKMAVSEAEERAKELQAKYTALRKKYQ